MVDTIETTVARSENASQTKVAAPKTTQSKGKAGQVARRMPIGEGETVVRGITVLDDNKVKASFTFKLDDKSSERYSATVMLDYTNVSRAEVLIDASRSHVITLQRKLREMGDGALDASVYQNVDVKRDLIEDTRKSVDPETRDLHAFARAANLSPADAKMFLAAIKAGKLKL